MMRDQLQCLFFSFLAGSVPSSTQGSRCVLEGLQHCLHRSPGRNDPCLPQNTQWRKEPVCTIWAGLCLVAVADPTPQLTDAAHWTGAVLWFHSQHQLWTVLGACVLCEVAHRQRFRHDFCHTFSIIHIHRVFITAKPFTTGKAVILWIVFCSTASGDERLEFASFIHLVASFLSFHSQKENCWEEASSVLCNILKMIKGLDSFKTAIMDCFSFSNAFLIRDSAEPILFSHLCDESMFHL